MKQRQLTLKAQIQDSDLCLQRSVWTGKPAHLLLVRNKHLLCLLDHGLGFQLFIGELVFSGVEELSSRHARQYQVCGIGLEVDVHLNGVWVNGGRCVTLCVYNRRTR